MFIHGYKKRMGRLVKQDVGISLEMLTEMLNVVMCAATFVILWAGALRGGEVLMLEASEFVKRRDDGRKHGNKMGHVVLPNGAQFPGVTSFFCGLVGKIKTSNANLFEVLNRDITFLDVVHHNLCCQLFSSSNNYF